jgi:hypothetical protein
MPRGCLGDATQKYGLSIFWFAVQKSVARFEGGEGVCVCKSHSMDSLLLSKISLHLMTLAVMAKTPTPTREKIVFLTLKY